jgi:hypothetical protein
VPYSRQSKYAVQPSEACTSTSRGLLSSIEKGPDRWPGPARIVIDANEELALTGGYVFLHDPKDAHCPALIPKAAADPVKTDL